MTTMTHKTVTADAVAQDQGIFTAIAAAYSVDRVGERIVKGAFARTIAAWRMARKGIPLHWNHSGDAADIIGTIDPSETRETRDGLRVKGKLDLESSEVAREAWRSMKANRVGLSFGYVTTEKREADDGIVELLGLDLFEVSITPAPANPSTRVLSTKGATRDPFGWIAALEEQRTTPGQQARLDALMDGVQSKSVADRGELQIARYEL